MSRSLPKGLRWRDPTRIGRCGLPQGEPDPRGAGLRAQHWTGWSRCGQHRPGPSRCGFARPWVRSLLLFAVLSATAIHSARADATTSAIESRTQQYSRVIETNSEKAYVVGDWIHFGLDAAVLGHAARELSDLRIVDSAGVLVPFRLRSLDPMETRWNLIRSLPLEWKPDPGGGWFAEVEIEDQTGSTILLVDESGVFIQTTTDPDDHRGAEVLSVDSQRTAWVLPAGHPRWKLTTSRKSGVPRTDAMLYEEERSPRPLVEAEFSLEAERFEGRTWIGRVELVGPERAVCAVDVQFGSGLEGRIDIEVEVPDEGWVPIPVRSAAQDEESRGYATPAPRGARRVEWTPIHRGRQYRLRVAGSSPPESPLHIDRVHVVPDEVEFRATNSPPFRLLYGDDYLQPRSFDLTPPEFLVSSRLEARLGPEEPNPFQAPPRGIEWLRRHPAVLSGALFAVLALIAALALTARRNRQGPGDR